MDYKKKLTEIESAILDLNEEKKKIYDGWIISESPVQIGDKIICNGYVFVGQEMIVDFVNVKRSFKGEYYFAAKGRVLKKNGEPGQKQAEWFSNRE